MATTLPFPTALQSAPCLPGPAAPVQPGTATPQGEVAADFAGAMLLAMQADPAPPPAGPVPIPPPPAAPVAPEAPAPTPSKPTPKGAAKTDDQAEAEPDEDVPAVPLPMSPPPPPAPAPVPSGPLGTPEAAAPDTGSPRDEERAGVPGSPGGVGPAGTNRGAETMTPPPAEPVPQGAVPQAVSAAAPFAVPPEPGVAANAAALLAPQGPRAAIPAARPAKPGAAVEPAQASKEAAPDDAVPATHRVPKDKPVVAPPEPTPVPAVAAIGTTHTAGPDAASATAPAAAQSGPAAPPPAPTPPPAPAPAPAPPAGPAAQLGAAFVSLPRPAREGEPQMLVIRLDPQELGRVQIRVERGTDGTARVALAVERADTLAMLMQDRPRLDQALTAAGVPQDGRSVSFSLGEPQQGAAPQPAPPDTNAGGMAGGSGGSSGGGSGGQEQRAPDHRGWGERHQQAREGRAARAWARAGIDITA